MAILDNLLGGGDSSQQSMDWSQQDAQFATNPNTHVHAQDVLHSMSNESDENGSESSEFTGIGDLGVDIGAPTFVGVSNASSSEQSSTQDDNNGGLLGGLI